MGPSPTSWPARRCHAPSRPPCLLAGRCATRSARCSTAASPTRPMSSAPSSSSDAADLDLAGRVAVVTGAGRGIGAAYARALASRGAAVVVADIDGEAASSAAKQLSADGFVAVDATVDISQRSSTLALAEAVRTRFGTVHIVVNNAAIYHSM